MKRFVIRSFAWGAGCSIALIVALAAFLTYEQRPKVWNTTALRVKSAKADSFIEVNDKFDVISSSITFSMDVENTTRADVTLPHSLTTMGQTRGSHSLHDSFLELGSDYFLPAHHVTTISLVSSSSLCAANDPPQQCFDDSFKHDEGFVIFDEADKYEILIPIPALTLSTDAPKPAADPYKK